MKKMMIRIPISALLMLFCFGYAAHAQVEEQDSTTVTLTVRLQNLTDGDFDSWMAEKRDRLDALTRECESKTFFSGISVYDLDERREVLAYQARKAMRPASTMKLLTAVTALDRLGANHDYVTSLGYTGSIADSTLSGDIYVVGGFDPAFNEADLNSMANAIHELGIRRIEGRVLGDVSMKDTLHWGSGWCWDDAPSTYEPYLTPLLVNRGCVKVSVNASKVSISPSCSMLTIDDQRSATGNVKIDRNWVSNGNVISLTGSRTGSATRSMSVFSPERFFVCALADRLEERGIRFYGDGIDALEGEQRYGIGTIDGRQWQLVGQCRHTVEQVLQQMMKDSDNLYAESMFYLLANNRGGKNASDEDGQKELENLLRKADATLSQCRVADGSGCSLYNYLTPETEVAVLRYAYQHDEIFSTLYPSLPIAGMDGTLASRMKGSQADGNVHAKTGTVSGVSALAGYVRANNGHLLAFSMICNGVMQQQEARQMQDRLCQELAR